MWYYYDYAKCSRKCLFNAIIWIHGHDNVQMGVLLFLLEPVIYSDHVLFSTVRRAGQFIRIVITLLQWSSFNSIYSLSLSLSLYLSLSHSHHPSLSHFPTPISDIWIHSTHQSPLSRPQSPSPRFSAIPINHFTLLLSLLLLCAVKCFKDRVLGWKHELYR